ncbi:MAG TPA: site-specific integrase [Candidatus Solibacter sp.]|nr:site-specific integrase [Candidatus Solibacter sp.]
MPLTNVLEMPTEKIHNTAHGRIRERKGGFQIQFTDAHGVRRTKTLSTLKKAEKELSAQAALKEKNIVAEEGETRGTVASLAESYLLYIKNSKPKSHWWCSLVWEKHLKDFFGHLNAGRVDEDLIEKYRSNRTDAGAAPATINRETAILKAIFRKALRSKKIPHIPCFPVVLTEANPRQGFLTAEQYTAMQAACTDLWLRGLLAVAYRFGFRKSELLNLRVGQVDLQTKTISLLPGETKNGQGRTIVMTSDVLALISECIKGKQAADFVFTWQDGRRVRDFRVTWKQVCEKAGVSVLLHDFRRTAVRNMIRKNVSRDIAKKISGHATDAVFSRYNISNLADLQDAATKLED